MTDRDKLVELIRGIGMLEIEDCEYIADHLIANCVTIQEPIRKAEDCRCYTKTNYGGACLGTKEIDPCKGDGCERWKPKEE
jgi:hypothetical protein